MNFFLDYAIISIQFKADYNDSAAGISADNIRKYVVNQDGTNSEDECL